MASLSDVVKDMKKDEQKQEDEPTNKIIRDDWQQPPTFYLVKIMWVCLITAAAGSALFLTLLFAGRI